MTDLLIFGVDGMNPRVSQQYAEQGDMPVLQSLRSQPDTVDGKFKSHVEDGYNYPHTGPCFPAGTLVLTEDDGLKPIEQIEKGDKVKTHRDRFKEVIETMERKYEGDGVYIGLRNGYEIRATDNHPFWAVRRDFEENGWTMARSLTEQHFVGSVLDGPFVKIDEKYLVDMNETVYNLEVADDHSYTANGAVVHNCWTTIYTGVGSDDHGVTEGGWREGESNFDGIYTIFDTLSDEGIDMTLFTMPMTYPAKELNGSMVSGFIATPMKSLFHKCLSPEDMDVPQDKLRKTTATYMAKRLLEDGAAPSADADDVDKLIEGERERMSIYRNNFPQDRTLVAYGTTLVDKTGHIDGINPKRDKTKDAYQELDALLGALIDFHQPDDVLIISDHGFSDLTHDLYGYGLSTTGDMPSSIFDVAPWLASYFGIEYDERDYGEVNTSSLSEDEREQIQNRLKDLGYIA